MRIDHATIAGTRLEEMRKVFTAATGIPTEYGGAHSNHATEMALASFPDGSYLELMGIPRGADPAVVKAHTWSRFLQDNGGPCAFALRVPDVNAEIQRLAGSGVHVGAAEKSGRTRPDGVSLSWETADIGSGPRGSFFPFLIRDFTPRENRVYPSGKPTSTRVRGIGLVVIGVRSLEDSIAQYRKAFQLPAPKRQRDETFGADLAWFEGTPVVLAASLNSSSWLANRIARYGDSPCAFVLATTGGAAGKKSPEWFDGHSCLLDRRRSVRVAPWHVDCSVILERPRLYGAITIILGSYFGPRFQRSVVSPNPIGAARYSCASPSVVKRNSRGLQGTRFRVVLAVPSASASAAAPFFIETESPQIRSGGSRSFPARPDPAPAPEDRGRAPDEPDSSHL